MQNEQQESEKAGLQLAMFFIQTWAASIEVFIHHRFGKRALGPQAAAVVLLVPAWIMAWPQEDPRPMLCFLVAYLFRCAANRLEYAIWRKPYLHTLYNGWPWVKHLKIFDSVPEMRVKGIIEPIIVLGIGCMMIQVSPPLGMFLNGAACCAMIKTGYMKKRLDIQAEDMRNLVIEQQCVADRFRGVSV